MSMKRVLKSTGRSMAALRQILLGPQLAFFALAFYLGWHWFGPLSIALVLTVVLLAATWLSQRD